MKRSFQFSTAALGIWLLAGCQLSPVISEPVLTGNSLGLGGLYEDCLRASEALCTEVEHLQGDALDSCVARATYDCVSGAR